MKRIYNFIRYAMIFTKAVMVSNYQVAKIVLSPSMRIRPGFVAIPMDAATDFEITSLANSITLTPGTVSVHISRDHRTLVVHALNVDEDPETLRRDIKQTLEANILKWTRK